MNRVNSHLGCHTAIRGDSGAIDFAYIDGLWFLIGSGGGPGSAPLHSIPEENRSDWARWVYGTTDDVDGDADP